MDELQRGARWRPHLMGRLSGIVLALLVGTMPANPRQPILAQQSAGATAARAVVTPRRALLLRHPLPARAAAPASQGPVASVISADAGTLVQHTNKVAAAQAFTPLFAGDDLRTGSGQHAVIVLRDGSRVRLNENTDLQIVFPVLYLHRGEIECTIAHGRQRRAVVRTDAAVAAVVGTEFDIKTVPVGTTTRTILTVVEGTVDLSNRLGSVLVRAGQQAAADPNTAPTQPAEVQVLRATIWTSQVRIIPIVFLPPHYGTPAAARDAAGAARARLARRPHDVAALLALAGALADTGSAAGALATYQRALALLPASDSARRVQAETGIATTAFALGDNSRADAAAQAALAVDPRALEAGLVRGDVALSRGDVAGAQAQAQAMHARYPDEPQPLLALGLALGIQGQAAAARRAFDLALGLHPPAWLAAPLYLYRAGLAILGGRYTQALADDERALQADPHLAVVWNNLGFTLIALGRYAEAEQPLLQGSRLGSPADRSLAQGNLAGAYYAQGRYGPMLQAARTALALSPHDALLNQFAAVAEGSLGHWPAAAKDAQQAAALAPQLSVLQASAAVYQATIQPAAAETMVRTALRAAPDDPNLLLALGSVLTAEGHAPAARAAYQLAYAHRPLAPANAETWAQAATLALQAGRAAEAVADLRHATALRPANYQYWISLAGAEQATHDYQGALAATGHALAINPDGLEAHTDRAQIYRTLGDTARRAAEDRTALRQDPHLRFLHGDLASMAQQHGDLRTAAAEERAEIAVLNEPDNRAAYNSGSLLSTAWQALGNIDTSLHQPAAALSAYRRAVAADPRDPWAHGELGVALEKQGDWRGARDQFTTQAALLAGRPTEQAVALVSLGQMREALGDHAGALAAYRQAVADDGHSANALEALGLALYGAGQPAAARAQFAALAALNPHDPLVNRILGLLDTQLGQNSRAVTEFRRQIALDGRDTAALTIDWRNLGYAAVRGKLWSQAVAAYTQVVALGHATDLDYLYLGYVQKQSGLYAAAVTSLERARSLAQAGQNSSVAQTACRLLSALGHPCSGKATATPGPAATGAASSTPTQPAAPPTAQGTPTVQGTSTAGAVPASPTGSPAPTASPASYG